MQMEAAEDVVCVNYAAMDEAIAGLKAQVAGMTQALDTLTGQWRGMVALASGQMIDSFQRASSDWMWRMRGRIEILQQTVDVLQAHEDEMRELEAEAMSRIATC